MYYIDYFDKNIISKIVQISTWIDRIEEEQEEAVSLSAFLLFYLAGLAMSMVTLYLPASQILIANPRDSKHIIKEMIDKKPMIMVNVPTLYLAIKNNEMAKKIPRDVLNEIKAYISGAAPFPAESINDFESSLVAKNKVLEVYGIESTDSN
ncbi:MAG: AMP-binding protein [Promethearchaeota archaeon]